MLRRIRPSAEKPEALSLSLDLFFRPFFVVSFLLLLPLNRFAVSVTTRQTFRRTQKVDRSAGGK